MIFSSRVNGFKPLKTLEGETKVRWRKKCEYAVCSNRLVDWTGLTDKTPILYANRLVVWPIN